MTALRELIERIFPSAPKPDADVAFLRACAADYRRAGDQAEAQVLERIADRLAALCDEKDAVGISDAIKGEK